MTFEDFKKELMDTIKNSGELKPVFDKLMPALSDTSDLLDEFIILNQSYNAVERQFNKGLISRENHKVEITRIVNSLVIFIRDELKAEHVNLTAHSTATNQELSPLSKAIQEMGFNVGLGPAALVNCDRYDAHEIFCQFFGEKTSTPYQFYFIIGNSEQLPQRFGERLIYTIVDGFTNENEVAVDYPRSDERIENVTANRATIEQLPAKFTCELSKQAFKRYCDDRFKLGETSLEEFIAIKSKQLAFKYIAFVFEYKQRLWNTEMLNYFEWLMNSFRQNHTDKPTFLFFFVINTDRMSEPDKVHKEIETLVNHYVEASLMMPDLMSVEPKEVKIWLKSDVEAKNIAKVDAVFSTYMASIERANTTDPIEMMHLEELQKSIYAASLATK
jgi:Effector-associated domain 11/inactive STAND